MSSPEKRPYEVHWHTKWNIGRTPNPLKLTQPLGFDRTRVKNRWLGSLSFLQKNVAGASVHACHIPSGFRRQVMFLTDRRLVWFFRQLLFQQCKELFPLSVILMDLSSNARANVMLFEAISFITRRSRRDISKHVDFRVRFSKTFGQIDTWKFLGWRVTSRGRPCDVIGTCEKIPSNLRKKRKVYGKKTSTFEKKAEKTRPMWSSLIL